MSCNCQEDIKELKEQHLKLLGVLAEHTKLFLIFNEKDKTTDKMISEIQEHILNIFAKILEVKL